LKRKATHRINSDIRTPEVRVIDSESGEMLGVMKTFKAIKMAHERGVDLVEIAANAKPPVVKIIDYGKFQYQEEKRTKEQLKKQKASEVKEIRFSPFIGEADYQTRVKRLKEFLGNNNKVKVVVVFKGRQMGSKKFGYELIQRVTNDLGEDTISIDMKPKFVGRHLISVVSPLSKAKQALRKKNEESKS
jgi:translation initiation factor IF-3